MSPLVQHKQAVIDGSSATGSSADQHWAMLVFESASAGIMALFAGFIAVTVVVGIYVIVVWPLTFWDLGNLHLERYSSWVAPGLWSVFGGGTLAGFLCFSGLIFGSSKRRAVTVSAAPARIQPTVRYKEYPPSSEVNGRVREINRW